MRKHSLVVMSALLCICARTSPADESARAQMKGLDEQVQEVKSDVLSIAAELNQLEEKLLYPSDTHLAVFVSLAHGETLRLDAVQIQIDGRPATHYIYSFKELDVMCRRPSVDLNRSEEHTSELQSRGHLVCRLLLEKKKNNEIHY